MGPTVVIVGAGMSGLCMGVKLKQAGIESFTILEKARDVGGTWRENTYPGLSCDIPSRYYTFSFEPNPDWSRQYSPGGEIQLYLRRVADRYGLRPHIRLGTEVTAAAWDGARWQVRTASGDELEADFLVSASGFLHRPRYPDLPGLDEFAGATFHSARWDHDVELRGRRVGVIGTGSSGVQIVTALSEVAGRLVHFQRTPQWILPAPNLRHTRPGRALRRRLPLLDRLGYLGWRAYIEHGFGTAVVQPGWQRLLIGTICRLNLMTVRDRELRRRLTPSYDPMCKRLVVSAGFYRAVRRPNVDVAVGPIERVEPAGVVAADGRLHELDVLVLATGFDTHSYMRPMELVGEGGITIDDAWRAGPRAYRSVAIPGFPNFFMMVGPHSPVGNQSIITVAESQADYVMRFVEMFRDGRLAAVVPTEEATDRFNAEMRAALPNTVWVTGCSNWYIGPDGLPEAWPWPPQRHREMLAEAPLDELELRTREPAVA